MESVNWSISLDQTTKNLYGPKYPKLHFQHLGDDNIQIMIRRKFSSHSQEKSEP